MYEYIQFDENPTSKRATPERQLWGAALKLFISDAINHTTNEKASIERLQIWKESYDDLLSCGELTRRLAFFTDMNPEWLSLKFQVYIQKHNMNAA